MELTRQQLVMLASGTPQVAPRGLGDRVSALIKNTLGIKPCGDCTVRQDRLNRLWPSKGRS